MSIRIGYLVQQFPPEVGAGPARVVEMASRWRAAGAEVTAFTGMPNRPAGRIHPDYRGKLAITETWDGIRVHRSWLYASRDRGFARTLANNVSFMLTSALNATLRAGGLDVLIASSPPFFPHASGWLASRARGVPLVLEVRDLWPDYLVGLGMLRPHAPATRALFALERALLRSADAVVVVTDSFKRRVIEKGVHPDAVHVMPNGVDPDAYYRAAEPPPVEALAPRPGTFRVGYLGNFGAGQSLGVVLEAAKRLEGTAPHIRIVLAGDGPHRAQLEAQYAQLGLSNVTLHEPIPKSATRAFYNNCDLCLVPLNAVPAFQETIPSKLFEIMACERPVLASMDGEGRRIVEESGAGWVISPEQPGPLADTIAALSKISADARDERAVRGRLYVLERFARPLIADRYFELLTKLARRRTPKPRAAAPSGRSVTDAAAD